MNKILTRDTALILAASFFYMASPMLVTPLITGFAADLGAGGAAMGIIGGGMNLCSLICRPFMGNLADKINKYKLSFIGAALVTLSCAGYIASWNTGILLFCRVINGIGYSCCSVCMSTWMSQLLPKDKIGSGMGLYGTMNALSMAAAPAIGIAAMKAVGYRASFCISLIFAVCTMIVIQFVTNKGEPQPQKHKNFSVIDIQVLPMTFTIMAFAIPYCATQSFLVNYAAAKNLHVSVGLYFPVYAAFLLVLRLSLKDSFDKVSFNKFLAAGSVSALASMFCMTFMESNILLFAGALFMAGGYGIMCTVCQSAAIIAAGPGRSGLANSTYYIGLDLGMTLGPFLGGIVYGSVPIKYFYPIFMTAVPLCIVGYCGIKKMVQGRKQK